MDRPSSLPAGPRDEPFLRLARKAAAESLFLLGFLLPTTSARTNGRLEREVDDVLGRVRALLDAVTVPPAGDDARAFEELRARVPASRPEGGFVRLEHATEVYRATVAFLRATRPATRLERIRDLGVSNAMTALTRFFTTIAVLVAAAFAFTSVEEAWGLVADSARVAGAIVLALVVLPLAGASVVNALFFRRSGKVLWWDLAVAPFRQVLDGARHPHGLTLFREESAISAIVFRSFLLRMGVHVVWWLVAATLWLAVQTAWGGGGSLTSLAVLSIVFGAVVGAMAVDFFDWLDPGPIRVFAVLLLAGALAALDRGVPLLVFVAGASGLAVVNLVSWLLLPPRSWRRLVHLGVGVAAVLVAIDLASVVATKDGNVWRDAAEPWCLKDGAPEPFERVPSSGAGAAWPVGEGPLVVVAASGGGSRAAIFTAHALEALHRDLPDAACAIQAVSSVSGGSLANAVYVSKRLADPRSCDADTVPEGSLAGPVSGDFILPVVAGTFLPYVSRSETLEATWNAAAVGLGDRRLSDVAGAWRTAAAAGLAFPVPLFNSSSLEVHDVVLSPLETLSFVDREVREDARASNRYDALPEGDEPTWVYYRTGIAGLDDLLPGCDPKLSSAVRASANFPYGFPLIEIETTEPLPMSPDAALRRGGDANAVSLTDGGVLSNSGFWSLYHLLRNRAGDLAKRGVLVFIVDASKMPEYDRPRGARGLADAIQSQPPLGHGLHRRMIESLASLYGDGIEVVQIDLPPRVEDNVPTTWSLSKKRRDQLRRLFDARWKDVAPDLAAAWSRLEDRSKQPGGAAVSRAAFPPRLPLD